MPSRRIWCLLVVAAWLASAPGASAWPYLPAAGHVFAGLTGGTSVVPFQRMVGKHPPVFEDYMTWSTPTGWLGHPDPSFRSRLGLEISTARGYGQAAVISPRGIALGRSDGFLLALGRNLARSGRIVYIRLMGEMDGYWNAYSAFSADGSFRGSQNSPRQFIDAWRRTVLILHGGPTARIDRRLAALGLPPIHGLRRDRGGRDGQQRLARPRVAFLWVPQDAGSPEIAANAPGVYWPGSAYVDWIGTDFYASYANFALLDHFYREFTGKPFVLSEWALYGSDDPAFVRALFAWLRSHRRVRMLDYYQGFAASSPADLAHYPRSRTALRQQLRSRRFLAYAPEYARPGPTQGSPGRPPLPPNPGPAPGPPPGPGTGLPPPPPICLNQIPLCLPGP